MESVLFCVNCMKMCELLMMSLWNESSKQAAVQHLQRSKKWRRTSRLLFSPSTSIEQEVESGRVALHLLLLRHLSLSSAGFQVSRRPLTQSRFPKIEVKGHRGNSASSHALMSRFWVWFPLTIRLAFHTQAVACHSSNCSPSVSWPADQERSPRKKSSVLFWGPSWRHKGPWYQLGVRCLLTPVSSLQFCLETPKGSTSSENPTSFEGKSSGCFLYVCAALEKMIWLWLSPGWRMVIDYWRLCDIFNWCHTCRCSKTPGNTAAHAHRPKKRQEKQSEEQ